MQQGEDVITEEEMEQCDENFIRKTGDNISQDTANKLAKQSSNQKQKTKENELREIIRKKDEEINQLINTSKISKMKELDSKYGQACAELMEERDRNNMLQKENEDLNNQLIKIYQNHDKAQKIIKSLEKKVETANKENEKLVKQKEEIMIMNGEIKKKNNSMNLVLSAYKKDIREKEETIASLKQTNEKLQSGGKGKKEEDNDKIKKEREKAKKLEQDNNRKGNKIKEL